MELSGAGLRLQLLDHAGAAGAEGRGDGRRAVRHGPQLVRRPRAALIAGAALALTPVAALMFRFNNPDALLVLLMTLAAYDDRPGPWSRGSTRWMRADRGPAGLRVPDQEAAGFPGPARRSRWPTCAAGQRGLGKRLWQLLAGLAALVAAAGWWVAIDLLTPASAGPTSAARPTTTSCSSRSATTASAGSPAARAPPAAEAVPRPGWMGARRASARPRPGPAVPPSGGGRRRVAVRRGDRDHPAVPVRHGQPDQLAAPGGADRPGRPGSGCAGGPRGPAGPGPPPCCGAGGWSLTAVVFSYMSGIIHPYYTVALAPAIAALAGIGAVGAVAASGTPGPPA